MAEPTHGHCRRCGKRRKLREDGKVPEHGISWPVSVGVIRTVGTAAVTRPCPGGGKPPKEVQDDPGGGNDEQQ